MPVYLENFNKISAELKNKNVTLVAVSKTKTADDILALYNAGQRDFGENYVQELVDKQTLLPKDIRWHFIGHLQTNKVKYIAPFVHLIHGVESYKLLTEINKQAKKNERKIDVLLQVHIAQEETKFGLDENELNNIIQQFQNDTNENIFVKGLMGMASFTNNEQQVKNEFTFLQKLFNQYISSKTNKTQFTVLSMGMSNDYKWAIEKGSNMVRIGSLLFGERSKP